MRLIAVESWRKKNPKKHFNLHQIVKLCVAAYQTWAMPTCITTWSALIVDSVMTDDSCAVCCVRLGLLGVSAATSPSLWLFPRLHFKQTNPARCYLVFVEEAYRVTWPEVKSTASFLPQSLLSLSLSLCLPHTHIHTKTNCSGDWSHSSVSARQGHFQQLRHFHSAAESSRHLLIPTSSETSGQPTGFILYYVQEHFKFSKLRFLSVFTASRKNTQSKLPKRGSGASQRDSRIF